MGTVGFVGLGNMGGALAANLVAAGHDVLAYDVSGPGRCPEGAGFAADVAQVAGTAGVVVLSLPDGSASELVAESWPRPNAGRPTSWIPPQSEWKQPGGSTPGWPTLGCATSTPRCPVGSLGLGPER